MNRIGASRLQQIARVLQVPVSFFFEDPLRPSVDASAEQIRHAISKFLTSTDGLALSRAFTRVAGANVRRAIVELVEEIASRSG